MFHTEDEFQANIDANPDDYFAKGVFADWLEENGKLVCWRCSGMGTNEVQWGKGDNDYIDMTCTTCNGTGEGTQKDDKLLRAEGYRAMLACGLHGANGDQPNDFEVHNSAIPTCWFSDLCDLPRQFKMVPHDWFLLLGNRSERSDLYTNDYPNRRAAEDALARAFTGLPEDRRRELLAGKRVSSLSPTSTTHSS